jgi:hypothetical protein
MLFCYYVLIDSETQYFKEFEKCGCVEGNRSYLINQIQSNPQFFRDNIAINYDFFVETLNENSIIYITNIDNTNLGACSIDLDTHITDIIIYCICVPFDDSNKGIGTLLLDKVKCIGELIKASTIKVSTTPSVCRFFEKNGFVIYAGDDDAGDDDTGDGSPPPRRMKMIYKFEKTPAKGGKRKTTSQKSKRKNKQCHKKRNKNFSKKRKYQKYHKL